MQGIANDRELRRALLGDLLFFHRFMFEKRTGREFKMSQPDGNESHFITVCRELEDAFYGRSHRLVINLPPGWAKSELCKSFIAWSFAHYPDCKFLYISHSFELATLHTASIKETMTMPIYRRLFGIEIKRDSSAKDFFKTIQGGAVVAFGSGGGITGHDAGLPGERRFTGAIVIDDIHKPEDIHSDTIRERIKRNYFETIERRLRSPNVPIILIGQRLHEDDLIAHLLSGADGQDWKKIIIKALDEAGNARYPEVNPLVQLHNMQRTQPYVFASQYQQDPMPAGGGLFQEGWFPLLDETPKILATFVTCDSAETVEEYNDATVFSFWGLYNITINGDNVPGMYGLYWIDCVECRIDPKDLKDHFLDFWVSCLRYPVKPQFAGIEKKSTGVTLVSVLKNIPGLRIIGIERTASDRSKAHRYAFEMQQYIASGQVSLPRNGKHTRMVLDHMKKITANNTHRFDDICDTCYDSIRLGLMDKVILRREQQTDHDQLATQLMANYNKINRNRANAYR